MSRSGIRSLKLGAGGNNWRHWVLADPDVDEKDNGQSVGRGLCPGSARQGSSLSKTAYNVYTWILPRSVPSCEGKNLDVP
jgi:hypothetical protein